jgi:hypothetical protein
MVITNIEFVHIVMIGVNITNLPYWYKWCMVQGWVIWNMHIMCISMATLVNVEWQLIVQSLALQIWAPNIWKHKKRKLNIFLKKPFGTLYVYIQGIPISYHDKW